jgi:hypothetical protein
MEGRSWEKNRESLDTVSPLKMKYSIAPSAFIASIR